MATYKTPGVYVEEISTLPASVAQVETAIPAFIGYTEKAKKKGESLTLVPTRIKSLPDYEELFGGPDNEKTIAVTIAEDSSGNRTVKVNEPSSKSKYLMWYNMKMYFANGGGPCYIVSVSNYKEDGSVSKSDLTSGLNKLKMEDEPTLIVFPDATGVSTAANFYTLAGEALAQCNLLQDRFAIIDTYTDGDSAASTLRSNLSSDYLKYGAAYYPHLKTILNYSYNDGEVTISHSVTDGDGVVSDGDLNADKLDTLVGSNDALYNQIKAEIGLLTVTLPPSSTMAGVYARVDSDRGVWKAPANVSLSSVIKPSVKITNEDQEGLNVDTTAGKSINAIRSFTGKGVLVWGARTLAGNDNEWRYISVRRFYNMVEESVKKATEKVVFEANDANTWIKTKAQIENFLNNLWRQGALAGAVPAQAFFVNIGLGQTMTAQDILEGRMIIEIGMAVVRPAEFIILRFSHKMQES